MKHGPLFAFVALLVVTAWYVSSYLGISFISSEATQVARVEHLEGWQEYEDLVLEGILEPQEPVLEFVFLSQEQLVPPLSVTSITKKNGYVPSQTLPSAAYRIQILDSESNVLHEQFFAPPIAVLPWFEDGAYFKILDGARKPMILQPLTRIPYENNRPAFHMIRADALLASSDTPPSDESGEPRFDIVFVPHLYGEDMAEFHSDAQRAAQYLAEVEPFFSSADRTYFSYIDIPADSVLPLVAVQSAGAPADEVIVLAKGVPLEQIVREFLSRR